ncbi:MAG: PhoH family protein [Eubacterium sp.]|nr:PhoH family protein [Eubacterium sp.]
MAKRFVIDTNVLLHNSPESVINGFADNIIYLTGTTLQELDRHKNDPGEVGYNARHTGLELEKLRHEGDLLKGVKNQAGGMVIIEPDGISADNLPKGYELDCADNRILSTCIHLTKQNPSNPVILVTNDTLMRVNAAACSVEAQSYHNEKIDSTGYLGWDTIEVTNSWQLLEVLHEEGSVGLEEIRADQTARIPEELWNGEYIAFRSGTRTELARYQNNTLYRIEEKEASGIKGRNLLQRFALDALMASPDKVPCVIQHGPAGTGKTLLSIASGLAQVNDPRFHTDCIYNKVLIARPNVTAKGEKDLGALPGELLEKSRLLLAPYFDSMEVVIRGQEQYEDNEQVQLQIQDYLDTGIIEILPLAYIRGRSLANSFVIVDEAQNASQQMIRDILTRSSGDNTKIVLCGDLQQIDNSMLNFNTSGLQFAIERMKGSDLVRQVGYTDEYSTRSPLCIEALKRLKL